MIERLKTVATLLTELAELDETITPMAQQSRDAAVTLDDAAFALRRYVERLELDPAELAEVTERLNLVNRLCDKYGGQAGVLEEVLAYRAQIGAQIDDLKKQDEDFSTSAEEIGRLEQQLKEVGAALTKARKKAAETLLPKVHAELADLGMKEARFAVEFQALRMAAEGDGEALRQKGAGGEALRHKGTARLSSPKSKPLRGAGADGAGAAGLEALAMTDFMTASGFETVEFMIAPNPGQPARPLRRIASGGELSRIMLALKGILAQRGGADRVSVLVFDEIDANVGGRMGTVIGEKLRDLSRVHQVLCITHLPQIASFADRHVTIRKKTDGGESYTTVVTMEGEERLRELAEMIAGKEMTETSLAQRGNCWRRGRGLRGRTGAAGKPKARRY